MLELRVSQKFREIKSSLLNDPIGFDFFEAVASLVIQESGVEGRLWFGVGLGFDCRFARVGCFGLFCLLFVASIGCHV